MERGILPARSRRVAVLLALILTAPLAAAESDLEAGRRLFAEGRFEEALTAFRETAEGLDATNRPVAAAARNNSCVLASNLGRQDEALAECQRAVDLYVALGDSLRLARAYNNVGLVHRRAGRLEEADAAYRRAQEINTAQGEIEAQTINLLNRGVVAELLGNYGRATRLHREAESLALERADEPWAAAQTTVARQNLAVALEKLGAHQESLEIYLDLLRQVDGLSPSELATLESNAGVAFRNLGDAREAQRRFERATALFRSVDDSEGLSNSLLNLGRVLAENLNRLDEAESVLGEALSVAREFSDPIEVVDGLVYLGRALLRGRKVEVARESFEEALQTARTAGYGEGEWLASDGLARVARANGDLSLAWTRYREAVERVERIGTSVDASRRVTFYDESLDLYRATIDVAVERATAVDASPADVAAALEMAERSKARDLRGQLGSPLAHGGAAGIDELRSRESDALQLHFVAGHELLYRFAVSSGSLEVSVVGDADEILTEAAKVHRSLSDRRTPAGDRLEELSRALLGGLPVARKVVVVSTGALNYLPFEILTQDDGFRLFETSNVVYAPSLSTYARRSSPDRRSTRLVAVAADGGDLGRGDLAAAALEVDRVASLVGGDAVRLLGARASEGEVLASAEDPGATILHFASHAVLDERPGKGAVLRLNPSDGHDGLLHADELLGLQIPSRLAVLAACSTRLGSPSDGNALASLAGALMAAGSASVLVTLWDVEDETTFAFVEQFYAQLRRGLMPSKALADTKRRLARDDRWAEGHPWSAFVLVGDSEPPLPSRVAWLRWPVALAAFFALFAARGLLRRGSG